MRKYKLPALLRIKQWSKSLLVFAPMLFARAFDPGSLWRTSAAFGAMCLMSSAVYIFNDLRDLEEDIQNPLKQHRPLASGAVGPGAAAAVAIICAFLSMTIACLLGAGCVRVLGVFLALNVCYTLKLKQLMIIDAMCIAAGFVLRLLLCGAAIDVPVTDWLCVVMFFLSLFMAFGKRKCELRQALSSRRKVLSHYTEQQLDRLMTATCTITLAGYTLFSLDLSVIAKIGPHLYFTVPIVAYGLFMYSAIIDRSEDGDPSTVLFRETPLKAAFLLWLTGCIVIMLWHL